MDNFELKIDTTEFVSKLEALPEKIARRAVRHALQAAGDIMADAIAEEAPERNDTPTADSTGLPPGVLKADISTQVQIKKDKAPRVKAGPTKISYRQAWWIEQGFDHVAHGKKTHVDANPFAMRGFERSIGAATDAFVASLAEGIDAAIGEK
jgi:hypothetical protein